MRVLLRRGQRPAPAHVHDAVERAAAGKTSDGRTDEGVPERQGFGDGCFLELPGEEKNQTIQTPAARRAGWDLAHGAGGYRPRPGISQVHRVLSLPERVPRAPRSPPTGGVD